MITVNQLKRLMQIHERCLFVSSVSVIIKLCIDLSITPLSNTAVVFKHVYCLGSFVCHVCVHCHAFVSAGVPCEKEVHFRMLFKSP